MTLVVPYDPRWPDAFLEEAGRIIAALADEALAVEHVGSTAVPGLAAKPIVDIAVAVRTFSTRLVSALEEIDYDYVPAFEAELPQRRYFRKERRPAAAWLRGYHLHAYEAWHEDFLDYLRFRDRLRTDPESAAAYEDLKRALVAESDDRARYQTRKGPFIEGLLAELR